MSPAVPDGLVTADAGGTVIRLHLQPRASTTGIVGIHGDELKVKVTSPPVDDAANQLCTAFFAKLFKVAKSDVTIISGHKSRHKRLRIADLPIDTAIAVIAGQLQH